MKKKYWYHISVACAIAFGVLLITTLILQQVDMFFLCALSLGFALLTLILGMVDK